MGDADHTAGVWKAVSNGNFPTLTFLLMSGTVRFNLHSEKLKFKVDDWLAQLASLQRTCNSID